MNDRRVTVGAGARAIHDARGALGCRITDDLSMRLDVEQDDKA